jgi:hypothetical protein
MWARSKGMDVGSRGRLAPEIVTAYNEAARSWAVNSGFQIGSRGRLPKNVIDAFGAAAYGANHGRKRGRTTRQLASVTALPAAEIRAMAAQHGIQVGSRGRIGHDTLEKLAAVG